MRGWDRRRARLRRRWHGRALLWFLSFLYGIVVLARRALYRIGLLPSRRLPAKVICVGNLTTGGTGKTPAVLLVAQTLRKHNAAVAVLSRGYGRAAAPRAVTTILDDKLPPWTECGDEPWMMHQALHGQNVPILVCADRARAGLEAVTYYHSKVLILDDGFQHHRLRRDMDVVLINACNPFGGGHLLPLGDLREPASGLSRAKLVVLTHCDRVEPEALAALKKQVAALNAKAPVLESVHRADFLLNVISEEKEKLAALEGRKVVCLSGIAEPPSFEGQLEKAGAVVAQRWRYPDHHPYRLAELKAIEKVRSGLPLVTTFKDFTRFPRRWQEALSPDVYVLSIKLEIVKGKTVWVDKLMELALDAMGAPA